MPLDEFKTQVLLLHSEQSTLDSLRSGFTEGYTVHCATSGSEALSTLGDTPINVIVSAQDLPGMSGLEALREAKKRSPDMIGILLAGDADYGLEEALVGDKEVFQIVRGNITADALLKLVEHATQQMRLMALAESANDNAADVDDDTAEEHIVMETSKDGATIISDGTGRMRALNPEAEVVVESAVGSRAVDLLVLTRDKDFLATIKESSRSTHTVHYASTLAQATETIRGNNVGVAVVDAGMVGDKIEQLTVHLRKAAPRIVSIVAGRRDDGEMLMDLINRGKVYRFLLKPVSPGRARLAIESSVKHHLESSDDAIETDGSSSAAQPATAATAQPKPEGKPPPERRTNKVVTKPRTRIAASPPPDVAIDSEIGSLTDDNLGDAFGAERRGDDNAGKLAEQGGISNLASTMAGSGGSLLAKPKLLGAAIVAFVVIAGSLLWITRDPDIAVAPDPVVSNQQAIDEAAEIDDVSSAVDAPVADTNDVSRDAMVDEMLSTAENALLESRLEDARAALRDVTSIDPDNSRLQFLNAQLSQMQLRAHLADARLAIQEQRFDDADVAIMAARASGISDDTEIDATADELQLARSEQRVNDWLATADARLEDGNLLSPADDNARYYYELALSDNPDNATARQGLVAIAGELALQARAAIESGNLDTAEKLLGTANELDPTSSELAAALGALASRRDEIAAERRQAAAKRRADEETAAARAEAARAEAARAEAARAAAAEVEAARVAAAEAEAAKAPEIAPEKAAVEVPAEATPKTAGNTAQTAAEMTDTATNSTVNRTPGMVSALKRIKYVAPKYPRAAQRRNLSGWVDVVFTVDTDGTVKDIVAQNSEPGETFVNAATKAVEKWLFEPVLQDGIAVEKRVGVRMMFALE